MSDRLPTTVLVGAMLRQVNAAGGFGTICAKGDAQAGGVLVVTLVQGRASNVLERGLGPDGATILIDSTPRDGDAGAIETYWRRRRAVDADLWVVELDIAAAERFAADVLLGN